MSRSSPTPRGTLTPHQMIEAIREAEHAVERAQDRYLDKSGWKQTCQTHGSYWAWEKTFPDGKHYLCRKSDALDFQQGYDLMEMNRSHAPVNDGDDFCTICGGEVSDHA